MKILVRNYYYENVYVSKLEFQIIDEMNEYDKKNLKKEDRDVNKLQLSTTKDKVRLIKVAYKYLITTEKFIVLVTVNATVQTEKK
ncbi:MAG: hypothetical protein ACRCZW_07710 [Lactobacillaceae bacterium]